MSQVQTVTGRIAPEALGFTLPHEHTGIALWQIEHRWDYWQLTVDDATVLPELAAYRAAGGASLVDLTLPGVGRDPERLRRYAEATGLNIVMGAGWYRAAYYPAEARIDRRTVDDLADELVREFDEGVAGTGIRPGIVGEIGTDKPWLTGQEERVHRAAARAARRTGMAITTHAVMSPVGLAQLTVFEEEGLDPARVVIGHADSYPVLDHHLEIVRRGANLEFDFLGMSFTPVERHGEGRIVELLGELVGRGHADRILLSQDVCHDSQLKAYGGNGYVYLFETFLPRLREAGLPESAIRTMTVDNPARILTLAGARS
jgi:predicted metal-dependent phosphotriesterase family hydrolase